MTPAEKKFLETHFKAGEYAVVTVMVKNSEFDRFMDALGNANLNLAIIPSVKPEIEFMKDGEKK